MDTHLQERHEKKEAQLTAREKSLILERLLRYAREYPVVNRTLVLYDIARRMSLLGCAGVCTIIVGMHISFAAEATIPGELLYPIKQLIVEPIKEEARKQYAYQQTNKRKPAFTAQVALNIAVSSSSAAFDPFIGSWIDLDRVMPPASNSGSQKKRKAAEIIKTGSGTQQTSSAQTPAGPKLDKARQKAKEKHIKPSEAVTQTGTLIAPHNKINKMQLQKGIQTKDSL